MPEVIFPGPDGRLEGRYHEVKDKDSPIALVLHPDPRLGVTMNNRVVYEMHHLFHNLGFTVLRFNFRGVGRSQGEFDAGIGELSDAASALDYLQRPQARRSAMLGRGFRLRRLDRHAALDAPPGDLRLHFDRAAGERL